MPGFVVTGGTGALGREVVRGLLLDGASVAVPWREEKGWQALRDAAPPGPLLWGAGVDLADPAAAARFMDEAAGRLDGLSGLAAVAGAWAGSGPLAEAPAEEWRRMMQANLDSAWTACRAALPHLVKTRGAIVTVGARVVETPGTGAAAYTVSKAGVVALTRVLAVEYRAAGVRANCVLPGTMDTGANRAGMPNADRSGWTAPEAVARVILFLLSPASAPVTGGVVPVDAPA